MSQTNAQGSTSTAEEPVFRPVNGAPAGPRSTRPEPDGAVAPRLRSLFEVVSLFLAPASVLSALLYYFGWTFTNARALYFGIDPSTFGYDTRDYLLRSVDPIFIPLGVLLLLTLAGMHLHAILLRWFEHGNRPLLLRLVPPTLGVLGCTSLVAGVSGVVNGSVFGVDFLLTPLLLAFGLGAYAYAAALNRRFGATAGGAPSSAADPRWLGTTTRVVVVLFMVLNLFWAVGDWANAVGRGRAQELARLIPYRPGVVVFSKGDLHIDAPGVDVTQVGDADSAYQFRYSGLSMLVYSDRKYFLVATQSPPETPTTIILADRDDLRLEFTPRSLS